jgi:hypothetical protein
VTNIIFVAAIGNANVCWFQVLFVWLLNGPSTQKVIRANTRCECSLTSYPGPADFQVKDTETLLKVGVSVFGLIDCSGQI